MATQEAPQSTTRDQQAQDPAVFAATKQPHPESKNRHLVEVG